MQNTITGSSTHLIDERNIDQVVNACVDGIHMRLQSLVETDVSFTLHIAKPYMCGNEWLEHIITFNKTDLSEGQQSLIRSINDLYRKEQNRVCLEMFKQPESHMHDYTASVTIWNKVPDSKQMISRSFAKEILYPETLKTLNNKCCTT